VVINRDADTEPRLNHPNTTVYCQDTNLLLKHAIDHHERRKPPFLLSNDGKTWCEKMPDKDGVDFIYGGTFFFY
jgi:DNA (cytosine-5)-methyltransferase 1